MGSRGWWDVPAVQRRINALVTGDPEISPTEFVAREFLAVSEMRALSLGCGSGGRECRWASTGRFSEIRGIDLSSSRIRAAQQRAQDEGLDGVLRFEVEDVRRLRIVDGCLDVVIAEGILHHLEDVGDQLDRIRRWLRPDGLLIVNEYVGPRRFQWTPVQVRLANRALRQLPEDLRGSWPLGRIKQHIGRPGWLSLRLYDPSEAVASEDIVKEIRSRMIVALHRPYGGTLLHLVLKNIAHHFVGDDPRPQDHLLGLFQAEDEALHRQEIGSDHVFMVARNSAPTA